MFLLTFIPLMFFFFKQKTAYEMRISDWSSDVCSSDLIDSPETLSGIVLRNILLTVALAPLAPWAVGIAVATPLGWNPARFLRDFGRWLPHFVAWTLILVAPMAVLHAIIDLLLIDGAGDWFWPLELFDGPLSTVMALLGLGLNAEAYRPVAQR